MPAACIAIRWTRCSLRRRESSFIRERRKRSACTSSSWRKRSGSKNVVSRNGCVGTANGSDCLETRNFGIGLCLRFPVQRKRTRFSIQVPFKRIQVVAASEKQQDRARRRPTRSWRASRRQTRGILGPRRRAWLFRPCDVNAASRQPPSGSVPNRRWGHACAGNVARGEGDGRSWGCGSAPGKLCRELCRELWRKLEIGNWKLETGDLKLET